MTSASTCQNKPDLVIGLVGLLDGERCRVLASAAEASVAFEPRVPHERSAGASNDSRIRIRQTISCARLLRDIPKRWVL